MFRDNYAKYSQQDQDLWQTLFYVAKDCNETLFQILQYLREVGTNLVRDNQFGYKLVPVIGKYGWQSQKEYNQEKAYLIPYANQLTKMLKYIARRQYE